MKYCDTTNVLPDKVPLASFILHRAPSLASPPPVVLTRRRFKCSVTHLDYVGDGLYQEEGSPDSKHCNLKQEKNFLFCNSHSFNKPGLTVLIHKDVLMLDIITGENWLTIKTN